MPEPQYGQGMVRPGCWWTPEAYAGGYIDRQYRVSKAIEAYAYDLSSFWAFHVVDAAESRIKGMGPRHG